MGSGCEDHDTSADTCSRYGAAGGAMTTALCDVLRQSRSLTYSELIAQLNRLLRNRGLRQCAQLTSSQRFDLDRRFSLTDIVPNTNPTLGRTFRRKFPPRRREMLGLGMAVGAGMILGDIAGDVLGGLFFG